MLERRSSAPQDKNGSMRVWKLRSRLFDFFIALEVFQPKASCLRSERRGIRFTIYACGVMQTDAHMSF